MVTLSDKSPSVMLYQSGDVIEHRIVVDLLIPKKLTFPCFCVECCLGAEGVLGLHNSGMYNMG